MGGNLTVVTDAVIPNVPAYSNKVSTSPPFPCYLKRLRRQSNRFANCTYRRTDTYYLADNQHDCLGTARVDYRNVPSPARCLEESI